MFPNPVATDSENIQLIIRLAGPADQAARSLEQHELVHSADASDHQITLTLKPGVTDYSDLATLLVQGQHKIVEFREDQIDLESAFMALTKGIGTKAKPIGT